jgi:hypothetical protein
MSAAFALSPTPTLTNPLDGDGVRLVLPHVAGFSGTLTLPPNDADAGTRSALQTSLEMLSDVPSELCAALAAERGVTRVHSWLSARSNDDVRFLPGDVGFDFHRRSLLEGDAVKYYALACDCSARKPRRVGPFFAHAHCLSLSNAGTPFHLHFKSLTCRRRLWWFV